MREILGFVLLLMLLAGCASQAFQEAKTANTVKAYQDYINNYPDTEEAQEAQRLLEAIIFDEATKINTIEAYEDYLKNYPNGFYSQNAQNAMAHLAYQDAQEADTLEAYQTFLEQYPNAHQSVEAKNRVETLTFEEANETLDLNALQQYLEKYPTGQYVEKAQDSVAFLQAKATHAVAAYEQYLKKYPNGQHVETVQNLMDTRKQTDDELYMPYNVKHSIEGYQEFIQSHPKNYNIPDAQAFILELQYDPYLKQNTIKGYETFMQKSPENPFFADALKRRDNLQFQPYLKRNSIRGYNRFIQNYPDNVFVQSAHEHRDQLLYKKHNKIEVSDPSELVDALEKASNNGQDDVILLESGEYPPGLAGLTRYEFKDDEEFELVILGKHYGPERPILDAQEKGVLDFKSLGNLTFSNVILKNLGSNAVEINKGVLTFQNVIIQDSKQSPAIASQGRVVINYSVIEQNQPAILQCQTAQINYSSIQNNVKGNSPTTQYTLQCDTTTFNHSTIVNNGRVAQHELTLNFSKISQNQCGLCTDRSVSLTESEVFQEQFNTGTLTLNKSLLEEVQVHAGKLEIIQSQSINSHLQITQENAYSLIINSIVSQLTTPENFNQAGKLVMVNSMSVAPIQVGGLFINNVFSKPFHLRSDALLTHNAYLSIEGEAAHNLKKTRNLKVSDFMLNDQYIPSSKASFLNRGLDPLSEPFYQLFFERDLSHKQILNLLKTDLQNAPRIQGSRVDMGPFEIK